MQVIKDQLGLGGILMFRIPTGIPTDGTTEREVLVTNTTPLADYPAPDPVYCDKR